MIFYVTDCVVTLLNHFESTLKKMCIVRSHFQEANGGQCLEYKLHHRPIVKMRLSYDDLNLITACDDGSVAIWRVGNCEGRTGKMDKDFRYCQEILMPKVEMREKMVFIKVIHIYF